MAAMAMVSVQLTVAARPLRSRRALSVFTCAAPPRQRPPPGPTKHRRLRHDADAQPPRKRGHPPPPPPRRTRTRGPPARPQQSYTDDDEEEDDQDEEEGSFGGGTRAAAMPKPPAGFVLDDQGRCIAAASKRIVTIIDDTNNRPLECIIRRVFRSTLDHDCMLLCPVDMPVQVLKSANFSGWIAVDDDQIKEIIPSVAYALARVHMHFVESGFCYTARGGFCFPEDAIQEFHDSGDGGDSVPFEGVEICCFNLDGAHYMIYTPVDPLLFVAVKDKDGVLRIAEDELMDDPAVVGAIDEETEFTALVEEEEALLESVLGER
ncbi:Os04g0692200 [Oryza sativa Japonica Group]|uniref:Os04g0692200 protein n=15 Tax=Oryza TaxID=4527 RepID=Q0J8Q7_ORYSJ|nr:uncharacterized protein LOC127770268 [Oryza glaberrima]KAB8097667.1 hypothetical protein EE612_026459 [Oryza sativa]KAF2936703.1 hypothetical protein DAI22_04g321400 [Oryza sativa Japonica Group]BAF16280.1 Os04g0692200 [Oryza sativa Japonica Group]BAG87590.1 unnamed protein product [Oryza sativa Japonica Group]BAG92654.1 unnamed protein product [Oryza sativa Japonica Group]|eukprot:NP_001054366.1 Os04g0692200 [Oryza sativa Japonica Group]